MSRAGLLVLVAVANGVWPATVRGQDATPAPPYERDRGPGVSTSMFGTYVHHRQWLVYPFLELYRDRNFEYAPQDLGATGDVDFRGRYYAREGLVFVAYGVTPNLAVEFELATIRAEFDKSPLDVSGLASHIEESGLGDVEGQVRWRWRTETETRPEFFSYFEAVVPHHRDRALIGTPGVELKAGTGVTRGHAWGTITLRGAIEFDNASTSQFDVGEYAIEYLKRVSRSWRLYAGLEGTSDELELITEAQWHVSPRAFIRLNSGLGLTSRATDWAPEIGVVFNFDRVVK